MPTSTQIVDGITLDINDAPSQVNYAIIECTRHYRNSDTNAYKWADTRCTHYRNRFVVETRSPTLWTVPSHLLGYATDQRRPMTYVIYYVEDLPDGDVIVEATILLNDPSETLRNQRFDELTQKMLNDIPPDPEASW